MRDYMEYSTVPVEEDCAQVGTLNYAYDVRHEYSALVNQLEREFGKPPEGVEYSLRSCPHEFGTYYQLKVSYDDETEEHTAFVYDKLEEHFPGAWDSLAKDELKKLGYTFPKLGAKV